MENTEFKEKGENMDYAMFSKVGKRSINEDYIDVFQSSLGMVFVLADGLGGHGGGEIASQTAVEEVKKTFLNSSNKNIEYVLKEAFRAAHNMLKKMQNEVQKEDFFKTTLVVLIVSSKEIAWGHIGDSRLYHFEQNQLIERTMDHSVPQMLVNSGDIKEKSIRHHEDRSRLTRVLGAADETSEPYVSMKAPRTDDAVFLLCSDGFWELINEKKMRKCLKKISTADEWLAMMERIVLKNGRKKNMDNYSAIAVRV